LIAAGRPASDGDSRSRDAIGTLLGPEPTRLFLSGGPTAPRYRFRPDSSATLLDDAHDL